MHSIKLIGQSVTIKYSQDNDYLQKNINVLYWMILKNTTLDYNKSRINSQFVLIAYN